MTATGILWEFAVLFNAHKRTEGGNECAVAFTMGAETKRIMCQILINTYLYNCIYLFNDFNIIQFK